jgi:hypothetical protein
MCRKTNKHKEHCNLLQINLSTIINYVDHNLWMSVLYLPLAQLQTRHFSGNIYSGTLDKRQWILIKVVVNQDRSPEIRTHKDHGFIFYVILTLLSQFTCINTNAWLFLCYCLKMNVQVYSVDPQHSAQLLALGIPFRTEWFKYLHWALYTKIVLSLN